MGERTPGGDEVTKPRWSTDAEEVSVREKEHLVATSLQRFQDLVPSLDSVSFPHHPIPI